MMLMIVIYRWLGVGRRTCDQQVTSLTAGRALPG